MPTTQIEIERSTFQRLQKHAQPLVDTLDTVVNRALDALDRQDPPAHRGRQHIVERSVVPDGLPNLRHTKVLEASVDGHPIVRPNWNGVVDRMLVAAQARVGSFEELRRYWPGNLVQGPKNDEGYRHLAELGISVQASTANSAGQRLVRAARQFGIRFDVRFMWRHRPGAAHPGESALLSVSDS